MGGGQVTGDVGVGTWDWGPENEGRGMSRLSPDTDQNAHNTSTLLHHVTHTDTTTGFT